MHSSLSWIEWLDRLDRVLEGAREDVHRLARISSPETLDAVERCKRQLSALANELRVLDRSVLESRSGNTHWDRAENLQRTLDATVFQLGMVANTHSSTAVVPRERMLVTIDAALRDSCRAAATLLGPSQRRA